MSNTGTQLLVEPNRLEANPIIVGKGIKLEFSFDASLDSMKHRIMAINLDKSCIPTDFLLEWKICRSVVVSVQTLKKHKRENLERLF